MITRRLVYLCMILAQGYRSGVKTDQNCPLQICSSDRYVEYCQAIMGFKSFEPSGGLSKLNLKC